MANNRIANLIKDAKQHSDKAVILFAEGEELHKASLLPNDTPNKFELTQKVIYKTREALREMEKVRELQNELVEAEDKEINITSEN